jgi:LmbE family N-acetylglucosaminyl deacetylase
MKKVYILSLMMSVFISVSAQQPLRVMMIFAHPDEGEVYTGGTAALYTKLGHQVKFMSLTNGDAGHWVEKPEVLAKRRYQEAMESKKVLNLADYEVLDYHDQYLKNTKEAQARVNKSIQAFQPDVVFTYYPAQGGHTDNMTAGYIVRDAVKDLKMDKLPVFLYVRDYHTITFSHIPDVAFPIDEVWETKLAACGAHKTQVAEAIPHEMGILDEVKANPEKQKEVINDNTYAFSKVTPGHVTAMEKWYGKGGAENSKYAEAFEVAEFGRQVSDAEMLTILPMLQKSYVVPGATDWIDTSVEIQQGDVMLITANGTITWKHEGREACDANGAVPYARSGKKPVTGAATGALIGRIGADAAESFLIGTEQKIIAPKSGRLYLGINDDTIGDNDGQFRVWIKKTQ